MNELKYRKLKKYKYQLTEDYTFSPKDPRYAKVTAWILGYSRTTKFIILKPDGTITLLKGYCWNGANIVKDTLSTIYASLGHDPLFQLLQMGELPQKLRARIDRLYIQVARAWGMWRARAWVHMKGLMMGSWIVSTRKHKPDKIYSPK